MRFFSKIYRLFSRKRSGETIIARFLSDPAHAWILQDDAFFDSFLKFLSAIPLPHLEEILIHKRLLLLCCNQNMSCSLFLSKGREVVLIFPELRNLMTSAQRNQAHAILAHEFGHIHFRHSERDISPLLAQFEADQYVVRVGLGIELKECLRAVESCEESAERLSMLRNVA